MKSYEKVKMLRLQNNWTQKELAEKMGYSNKTAVTRTESGDYAIPQKRLAEYAEVFGVPVSDMLDDDLTPMDFYKRYQNRQDKDIAIAMDKLLSTNEGQQLVSVLSEQNEEELKRILGIIRLL